MNTQTLTIPVMICNFIVASEEPILADCRDYGFDFDEDELGRELLAALPFDVANQSLPEVAADEFEERYAWFVS